MENEPKMKATNGSKKVVARWFIILRRIVHIALVDLTENEIGYEVLISSCRKEGGHSYSPDKELDDSEGL